MADAKDPVPAPRPASPGPAPGSAMVRDVQDVLEAAHAAALAMDGAALRRSLESAEEMLRDAVAQVEGSTAEAAGPTGLHEALARVEAARADLDDGRLSAMEPLIEAVRGYLKAL